MRPLCLIASFGLLVASLRADEKDDKAAEVKKLQGTWTIVSGEFSGKALTPPQLGIDTIVVAGEKMTLRRGDKEVAAYPFEVHPDKKPRVMVWTKQQGGKEGKLPVIYELDGAKLKVCFPLLGTTPPKEAPKPPESFETKDKPFGLFVAEKKEK